MPFNKTIQMCIFEGNPNGRIMCELSNWNGRVYKISRNEISRFAQRDDSENTGIYFLFGKDEDNTVVASTTVPSMSGSLVKLRNSLFEKGIIDKNNVFTRDYVFTSPSLAAAVVMGRNANGRTEWKTKDHKTLKEIEEENLN